VQLNEGTRRNGSCIRLGRSPEIFGFTNELKTRENRSAEGLLSGKRMNDQRQRQKGPIPRKSEGARETLPAKEDVEIETFNC